MVLKYNFLNLPQNYLKITSIFTHFSSKFLKNSLKFCQKEFYTTAYFS